MSVDVDYEDVCGTYQNLIEEAREQRKQNILESLISSMVDDPDVRHFLYEEDTQKIPAGTWGYPVEKQYATVRIAAYHPSWEGSKYVTLLPSREEVSDFTINDESDNIFGPENPYNGK